jgi:hypothetical protein
MNLNNIILLREDFHIGVVISPWFVIPRVQFGQYGTKSANKDSFLVLADFDSANIGVLNFL